MQPNRVLPPSSSSHTDPEFRTWTCKTFRQPLGGILGGRPLNLSNGKYEPRATSDRQTCFEPIPVQPRWVDPPENGDVHEALPGHYSNHCSPIFASFTFGALGDLITIAQIACEALNDSRGASVDYQNLIVQLYSPGGEPSTGTIASLWSKSGTLFCGECDSARGQAMLGYYEGDHGKDTEVPGKSAKWRIEQQDERYMA
jgi:hypothetical protein